MPALRARFLELADGHGRPGGRHQRDDLPGLRERHLDYTVTDDAGGTHVGAVTVTIDQPPVATPDTAVTKPGAATVIDVLGNDTDSRGKALTLVSVTAARHGTATIVDGKVNYTPEAGYAGQDTFTYLVRDADGGESTGQVSVTVANTDPVAVTDRAAVIKNGKTDIDVLANDTDVNTGQKLVVASVGAPAHGKATVTADGKVRYVPAAGFTGTDTFTYVVSDGRGGTDTATVTVTVAQAGGQTSDGSFRLPRTGADIASVGGVSPHPDCGRRAVLLRRPGRGPGPAPARQARRHQMNYRHPLN